MKCVYENSIVDDGRIWSDYLGEKVSGGGLESTMLSALSNYMGRSDYIPELYGNANIPRKNTYVDGVG